MDGQPGEVVVHAERIKGQFLCSVGTVLFLTWLCGGGDDLTILLVDGAGARLDQLGVGYFYAMGEAWLESIDPLDDDSLQFLFGQWRWRLTVRRRSIRLPRYFIPAAVLSDLRWWAPKWLSVKQLDRVEAAPPLTPISP
jgi:hypothetical protein